MGRVYEEINVHAFYMSQYNSRKETKTRRYEFHFHRNTLVPTSMKIFRVTKQPRKGTWIWITNFFLLFLNRLLLYFSDYSQTPDCIAFIWGQFACVGSRASIDDSFCIGTFVSPNRIRNNESTNEATVLPAGKNQDFLRTNW